MLIRSLSFLCLSLGPVLAEGLPPGVAEARLLPGWEKSDGTRVAALKLVLQPGWKTYWRSPGDAGVPPFFDWSGSANLADVTFHWPRPEVFESAGMRTLGYHNVLILPFEARPEDSARPLDLHALVDLGVCEDICVPVHLEIESAADEASPPALAFVADSVARNPALPPLPVPPLGGGDAEIAAALARVPSESPVQPVCTIEPIEDGIRLVAQLDHAPLTGDESAAIEMADAAIWVSEPELGREGNLLTASAELVDESGAPFAIDPGQLRLTLIGADEAVEFSGCAEVTQ